ncbi:MAG: hypothetical protein ABGY75_10795 [Gemmataceae bacterium]
MSDTPTRPSNAPADSDGRTPRPGEDGIRWELVHRMKRLIAQGKLDTPERWALAEEMLFRATEDRR